MNNLHRGMPPLDSKGYKMKLTNPLDQSISGFSSEASGSFPLSPDVAEQVLAVAQEIAAYPQPEGRYLALASLLHGLLLDCDDRGEVAVAEARECMLRSAHQPSGVTPVSGDDGAIIDFEDDFGAFEESDMLSKVKAAAACADLEARKTASVSLAQQYLVWTEDSGHSADSSEAEA